MDGWMSERDQAKGRAYRSWSVFGWFAAGDGGRWVSDHHHGSRPSSAHAYTPSTLLILVSSGLPVIVVDSFSILKRSQWTTRCIIWTWTMATAMGIWIWAADSVI
jgi:hypothetical protein